MQVWKCSVCLISVMFVCFIHFQAAVDAQSVKRTNFWFMHFYGLKTNVADMVKLGYGCIYGLIAQKWLISAEASLQRKCKQLLGLNFFLWFDRLALFGYSSWTVSSQTNHLEAWWTEILWTRGLEWNKSTVSNFLGPFVLMLVQDVVQRRKWSVSRVAIF